ncbi:hypothetical protein Psta_3675 [Pirellula staleyi DSM 6068]|uniref:Uncharacterized protein n=1 Tax=Pirellula staleyi (strain ATCC 27377 / DSM 6068 / ICPB 4128) TaxID=530564 RepID=D2QZW8_PIRSD|nr:hypothetical protein Psta_3675 [Pirellula staleyi DSM 6068]
MPIAPRLRVRQARNERRERLDYWHLTRPAVGGFAALSRIFQNFDEKPSFLSEKTWLTPSKKRF